MSRILRLGILLLLISCGGGQYSAPRDLDNACAIVAERPQYLAAMQQSERKWGVPVHVQMATVYQESKFVGNAKTPRKFFLGFIPAGRRSSAYGYSQALDGTWDDYVASTRSFGARRNKFDDAADFIGWYMDRSQKKLAISKWDAGGQYLAYHEGHGGYARGSYQEKAWLLRVADDVAARSEKYQMQLATCGKL